MNRNTLIIGGAVLVAAFLYMQSQKDEEARKKALAEQQKKQTSGDAVGGFLSGGGAFLSGAGGFLASFASMVGKVQDLAASSGGGTGAGSSVDERDVPMNFDVPVMEGGVA